jgi:3-hydroxyacyl-CoA dehydrogenase
MPLVEVVPHANTSSVAIEAALAFYESIGRRPFHIKQEIPGSVANRLQAALCNEAYSLVARGVLSAQDLGEAIHSSALYATFIFVFWPHDADACITTSLGPRWAMVGPFLANAMGGGGGSEGFQHLLEHLGPANRVWVEDMQAHKFNWSEESINALDLSVADELKRKDRAA